VSAETKVPNADMLDGHGSTRYGVGLQMGVATELTVGDNERFPSGVTDSSEQAISPEVLELRDFTAAAGAGSAAPGADFTGDDRVDVVLVAGGATTPVCTVTPGTVCHLPSNAQFPVPAQTTWNLRFVGSNLEGGESITYSYRAVR
jgi:hypothetical protein